MFEGYSDHGITINSSDGSKRCCFAKFYVKHVPDYLLIKEFPISETTTIKGNELTMRNESFIDTNRFKMIIVRAFEFFCNTLTKGTVKPDLYSFKLVPSVFTLDLGMVVRLQVDPDKVDLVMYLMFIFDTVITSIFKNKFIYKNIGEDNSNVHVKVNDAFYQCIYTLNNKKIASTMRLDATDIEHIQIPLSHDTDPDEYLYDEVMVGDTYDYHVDFDHLPEVPKDFTFTLPKKVKEEKKKPIKKIKVRDLEERLDEIRIKPVKSSKVKTRKKSKRKKK